MQSSREHPSRGLAVDIISSIDGNDMLDVMLLANDGGEVPASRFILGARSPVLQQLLFNKDSVSTPELKLPYSTNVISTLVLYCRTNQLGDICQPMDEASAREIVKLCQCAVTFQLSGLETLVGNLASSMCQADSHLACAIYDEAAADGGQTADPVKYIALGVIRRNPEGSLLRKNEFGKVNKAGGVSFLRAASLEQLLSDRQMCTEEINLFRAVLLWVDASSHVDDKVQKKMDAWATLLSMQDRRAEAKMIVEKCIDLSKIAPSDLMGVVSDSGLVDEVNVTNAMIQLALRVEKEGVEVSKRRDGRPPPSPTPPPQIVYCHDEESNSVAEILGRVRADTRGSSQSYEEHVEQSNKRKPKKQEPKVVTPQKEPVSAFSTPERLVAPKGLAREPSQISTVRPSTAEKKKRRGSSVGSEIRKAIGMFLRDKVDSMCIRPNATESD